MHVSLCVSGLPEPEYHLKGKVNFKEQNGKYFMAFNDNNNNDDDNNIYVYVHLYVYIYMLIKFLYIFCVLKGGCFL